MSTAMADSDLKLKGGGGAQFYLGCPASHGCNIVSPDLKDDCETNRLNVKHLLFHAV